MCRSDFIKETYTFKYTGRFRGRSVPSQRRALYCLRAVLLSPLILIELRSLFGYRKSRSRLATTFLNDITNSTLGKGLDFGNFTICFIRNRLDKSAKQNPKLLPQQSEITKSINSDLIKFGFSKVPGFISSDLARALLQETFNMSGYCRPSQKSLRHNEWLDSPDRGPRFDVDQSSIARSKEIDIVANKPLLFEIAKEYLGCSPILASVQIWTTRPPQVINANVLDESAMAFHCDSDYFGFLKFFVLLTEVNPENGPFTFVSESHRGRRHVVGRMKDSEVITPTDVLHLGTGRPGDLVIADTKGWHKAAPPTCGVRTMLQIVYTSSLFGAPV